MAQRHRRAGLACIAPPRQRVGGHLTWLAHMQPQRERKPHDQRSEARSWFTRHIAHPFVCRCCLVARQLHLYARDSHFLGVGSAVFKLHSYERMIGRGMKAVRSEASLACSHMHAVPHHWSAHVASAARAAEAVPRIDIVVLRSATSPESLSSELSTASGVRLRRLIRSFIQPASQPSA